MKIQKNKSAIQLRRDKVQNAKTALKTKPTIVANCLVMNEERWVWYAINSVIDYVDKILVYDAGSTDNTYAIIKSIQSPKIELHKIKAVTPAEYTKVRQEMLDRTSADWLMILDGDEIWPEITIQEAIESIHNASKNKLAVHVGYRSCVGDIFHYSKEIENLKVSYAPSYLTGGVMARFIKTSVANLHCVGVHGNQGYVDKYGKDASQWGMNNLIFLKNKFFSLSYLQRSSSVNKDRQVPFRNQKTRFYKGIPFPLEMHYPEVFYKERPDIVPSPFRRLSVTDELKGIYFRTLNFYERMIRGEEIRGLAH